MIRDANIDDARQIADIYNYYIENSIFTFEEEKLEVTEMEKRIEDTEESLWLVEEIDDEILGYAYAKKWHTRSAFRYTYETTIYVKNRSKSQGFGKELYRELIKRVEEKNIHSLIGVIAIPNEGSQNLHRKLGFKKMGKIREAGYKFNRWIDVEYWQKFLKSKSSDVKK